MTEDKPTFVLFSDDPHLLYSRVRYFGRTEPGVRVEASFSFPEVRAALFPRERSRRAKRTSLMASARRTFMKRFGPYLVSAEGLSLPEHFVRTLVRAGKTAACAESCTGGLMAHLVTGVSGSSDVLAAGIVAYENEAKTSLLGVKVETLARYGAVSRQVVEEMLAGAQAETGADCAMASSGIAGPTGGTALKPVGLVYVGARQGTRSTVRKLWLAGMTREDIKIVSAHAALKLLLDLLKSPDRRDTPPRRPKRRNGRRP
jgi:nicotinamide-nucleotide amidase